MSTLVRNRAMRHTTIALALVVAFGAAACSSSHGTGSGGNSAGPSATSGGGGSGNGPTNLRIAYSPGTGGLQAYVAQQQGFFGKHGLEAKLTENVNLSSLPPVLGKTFDVAETVPTIAIAAAGNNIPITVVSGGQIDTSAAPQAQLVVRSDSDIHSVADLKGKRIAALTLNGTINLATLALLGQHGVQPSQVTVMQVALPNMTDQLLAGRVDCIEAGTPINYEAATDKQHRFRVLQDPFVSLGNDKRNAGDIFGTVWGANANWASSHSAVVKDFQEAMAEATDYIAKNPTAARKALEGLSGVKPGTYATTPLQKYGKTVPTDALTPWLDLMKRYGHFKGSVDVTKLVFQ